MANDVQDNRSSIPSIAATVASLAQYAETGGFNDLKMLARSRHSAYIIFVTNHIQEFGNGGLAAAEERAHFGLWAIAKSPLIIGTDLSRISSASLTILKNAVSIPACQYGLP